MCRNRCRKVDFDGSLPILTEANLEQGSVFCTKQEQVPERKKRIVISYYSHCKLFKTKHECIRSLSLSAFLN